MPGFEDLSPSLGVRRNALGQPVGKALPGWKPCEKLPDIALTGRLCAVVPFEAAHAAPLFAAFAAGGDDGLWTYMPYGPFATAAELEATTQDRMQNNGFHSFSIMPLKDRLPIGQASFLRYDPAHGSVEIGAIAFSAALKRSTVATEALYLMMKHAFDHGYRRCEWKCDQLNLASNRAALRLGFRFEGVFRNAQVIKGRRRDTAWYSVILEEWPDVRARLEAWLSPDNFDENGQQKTALSHLP